MWHPESWFFILAVAGLLSGSWSIYWTRTHAGRLRGRWGRRLFVFTLVTLCGCGFVAAGNRADSLVTLGLLAAFLLIAMLWELPAANWNARPPIPTTPLPD